MDRLFQDLNHVTQKNLAESVHLADLPKVDKNIIDEDLEKRMRLAQDITSMVLSLRKRTFKSTSAFTKNHDSCVKRGVEKTSGSHQRFSVS